MEHSYLKTKSVPSRAYLRERAQESQPSSGSPQRQRGGGTRPKTQTASKKKTQKDEKKKAFFVGMGMYLPFLILILSLVAIGMIMMFSASYPTAYSVHGDSFYFLKKQLNFAIMGLAIMIGVSYFDYRKLFSASKWLLALSYIVLVVVLLMPSESGIKRWIGVGSFTVQASEITKFCIIVFLAYWGTKYADKMKYIKYGFLPGAAIFLSTAVLLLLEPHYSCIVIVFLLVLIMLYLAGLPLKYFIAVGIFALLAFAILLPTGILGYAMTRMDGWGQALKCAPDDEMWQTTWQTRNSLYAIGSGGVWGLGLGQSRQKFLYLPEPQNDFVFAVVCEELGLIGAIAILALFGALVWQGFKIAMGASDTFGKLLASGLCAQVGLQVILNVLVITDWLPNTGISLPFFSYGGSSLIMLLAQMGIVISVSRTSKVEKV